MRIPVNFLSTVIKDRNDQLEISCHRRNIFSHYQWSMIFLNYRYSFVLKFSNLKAEFLALPSKFEENSNIYCREIFLLTGNRKNLYKF